MCDKCKEYEDHIADLRNKAGVVYTYWQMKRDGYAEKHPELFAECEKRFIEYTPLFIELLKKEI